MKQENVLLIPSLLSAPFAHLGESLQALESCGIRLFHFDVMDGHYVPRITFGPMIIKQLEPSSGNITCQASTQIGYLPQNPEYHPDQDVFPEEMLDILGACLLPLF